MPVRSLRKRKGVTMAERKLNLQSDTSQESGKLKELRRMLENAKTKKQQRLIAFKIMMEMENQGRIGIGQ